MILNLILSEKAPAVCKIKNLYKLPVIKWHAFAYYVFTS